MRYRIHTLLIVTAWIGLICLALRTPTPVWASAISCVTLLALLISVLVIVYRRARTRAFAVGFLLFGGSYLALILYFGGGRFGADTPRDPLGYLAKMLYGQIHGAPLAAGRDFFHHVWFCEIIQLVSASLLGVLGGVIAQMLYAVPLEAD